MAYIDYSSHWVYKQIISYQDLNQLGANDEQMIRQEISDTQVAAVEVHRLAESRGAIQPQIEILGRDL